MLNLKEALNILKEDKHPNYPNVVKGFFYRKNFNVRGFRHPLCVTFRTNLVNDIPYPFYDRSVNDQNAKAGSRLNFLTQTDAEKWPNGDNVFLAKDETIAVRIDIDGDIPVYADLNWVKSFTPNAIHPTIQERMKEAPVNNPFESQFDLQKRQEREQGKETLINYLTTTYEANIDPKNFQGKIDIQKIVPNTSYNGTFEFHIAKASWYIDSIKLTNPSNTIFLKQSIIESLKKLNYGEFSLFNEEAKNQYEDVDWEFPGYNPNQFNFTLRDYRIRDYTWSLIEVSIDKETKIKTQHWINKRAYKLTIDSFESFIQNIKDAINNDFRNEQYNKLINDFIDSYNFNDLQEVIHINVKDLDPSPLSPETNFITKEEENLCTAYLLENYANELRDDNVFEILNSMYNNYLKVFEVSETLTNFSFLYCYFLDNLNYNLLENEKIVKLYRNQLNWFRFTPRSGKIKLSKIVFDIGKSDYLNFGSPNNFIFEIENGITSFANVSFGYNGIVILPDTINEKIELWKVFRFMSFNKHRSGNIRIKFKPVKDKNGELISSFTVNKKEFEIYKMYFDVEK